MRRWYFGLLAVLLSAMLLLVACGGGNSTTTDSRTQTGALSTIYVIGSDAPLPSVVGFQIEIDSLTLSDGTNTRQALAEPSTVDFSRLLGLRTLLALNQVPAGTYTSATMTLSKAVISYLDLSGATPKISTINATLSNSTLTLPLNPSLTVTDKGLGGLHLHFNLRDSIFTDTNGDITGVVNPQIQLRVLNTGDEDAHIDELLGGIVSTDTTNNQFVMQRWHGRHVTVKVNNQTQWNGSYTLAALQQNYTVEVSGLVQADGSILADSVEVVSTDKFFLGGLVLQVIPPTGSADSFSLFVRTEMPDLHGITVPGVANLAVNDNTNFGIRNFGLPMEAFLFNRSMMVMGQRVGVAGSINPDNTLDVKRVMLRRQGLEGKPVLSSVQLAGSGNKEGSFLLQNNAMFGYILGGQPIKVMTSNMTMFRNLPNALQDINNLDGRIVMWGLVMKDSSGKPVFVAGYVAKPTN